MKPLGRIQIRLFLIMGGTVIFLTGTYMTGGLYPFESTDAQLVHSSNWQLFALMRDLGAIIVAAAVIVGGLKSIRAQGASFGRIFFSGLGYGIIFFFCILHGIAYFQTTRILTSYDFSNLVQHLEKLMAKKDLPENKRKVLAKKLAESRYLQSGELKRPTAGDADQTVFIPSKEIIRFKQQTDQTRKLLSWIKSQSMRSALIWLAALIFSSVFGVLSPLSRNSKSS